MLSHTRLQEIKARLDKTTQGSWQAVHWEMDPRKNEPYVKFPEQMNEGRIGRFVTNGNQTSYDQDNLNTDFIANSHSDITDLLNMALEQDKIITQDLLLDSLQAKALYLKGLMRALDLVKQNNNLFRIDDNCLRMDAILQAEIDTLEKS